MTDLERIQRDKATILAIIKYVLITALVIGILYAGLKLFMILIPFAIGFVLARAAIALANRMYDHKARRLARNQQHQPSETNRKLLEKGRWPSSTRLAIILYFLLVILVFMLIGAIIFISINQIQALAEYVPTLIREQHIVDQLLRTIQNLSAKLGGLLDAATLAQIEAELVSLQQSLISALPNIATRVVNAVAGFVGSLPIVFFSIIVTIMSGYYFISDSKSVLDFIDRNVPHKAFREKTGTLIQTLFTTLFRVIGGYLLLFLITFFAVLIGLVIIRMRYAVIIALVAAIVDFLPVLGISATMIPISIYLFFTGNIWGGLGALILWAAITFLRRIIEPPILGNAMNLHPMATLFAMIVGIGFYGLIGILLGPVILVIAKEVLSLYGFDIKLRRIFAEVLSKLND